MEQWEVIKAFALGVGWILTFAGLYFGMTNKISILSLKIMQLEKSNEELKDKQQQDIVKVEGEIKELAKEIKSSLKELNTDIKKILGKLSEK